MSMKTIKEWARLCSDDTIRRQWIDNANAQDCYYWNNNCVYGSMYWALSYTFDWTQSPQGFEYWRGIHDDMERNPEKYLRKRKKMFHEYENN